MNARTTGPSPGEQGFSLTELIIVMGIIAVMAGVALPSIAVVIRNYKINGAEREVSSELSSTRTRAISKNTQSGVSFMVVDANSYRFIMQDAPAGIGPLHDLPSGVVFDALPNPLNTFAVRFNRLGAACDALAVTTCAFGAPANPDPTCPPTDGTRCSDGPGANYLSANGAGTIVVGLREVNTGLRRVITVLPGGRIQTVPQ